LATIVEDITSTKKRLKIEIPADILEKEYTDSLNKVRQRARIPGFRQGKTPMTIIEKRFGDEVRSELLEKLVPSYYAQAVKEAELSPVTMPKIEGELDLKRNEPLSFSLTIEVRPRITNLDYSGLKVDEVNVSVGDNEVEETLNGLRNDRAMFDVVDREVREDDLLIIDYVKLDPSGENELATAKDQVMNLGNGLVPQGIMNGLLGKKKGETAEIALPEVNGAEIKEGPAAGNRLRITIKEVKEKRLPDIDDEFAKDFGNESLDELKTKIMDGLLLAKQEQAKKQQKNRIVEMILEKNNIDLPESLVDAELQHLVSNEKMSNNMPVRANDAPDDAKDAELAERLRPKAMRSVKSTILLDEIADIEKVAVTENEVKDRIGMIAKQLQATPDAVINLFMTRDGSLDSLRHNIREDKLLDLLLTKSETVRGA